MRVGPDWQGALTDAVIRCERAVITARDGSREGTSTARRTAITIACPIPELTSSLTSFGGYAMHRAIPGLPVIPSSAEVGGAPDRQPSLPTQPPADVDAHAGTRSDRQSGLAYQPGLDGLRALSIIAVLLYHAGVSWAGGGFLGGRIVLRPVGLPDHVVAGRRMA